MPARIAETAIAMVVPVMSTPVSWDEGLRILLVEDSVDNQLLFQAYFKKSSHHLAMVDNGLEAVARVREESFDLVLMDIQMPEMDGYTATRLIRQWEQETKHPPLIILALSAHVSSGKREESLAAGCNEHLTKPITKQHLLGVIQGIGQEIQRAGQGGGPA